MSEAITQAAQKLLAHVEDKGEGRRSTCLPFDVEALRAALSQPAPSPQPTRHLTVTTTESGEAVMVSWQDDDHRILEVVWERKESALQLAAPVDEQVEFEAWARPNGYDMRRNDVLGHYSSIDTLRAWTGWQARASLQSPAPQTKGQP